MERSSGDDEDLNTQTHTLIYYDISEAQTFFILNSLLYLSDISIKTAHSYTFFVFHPGVNFYAVNKLPSMEEPTKICQNQLLRGKLELQSK